MKNNQPITNTNKTFSTDLNILSTTDLKGTITYANSDFMSLSGFSEDELVGKNHNIVRHPDMPPAAFANLWNELKLGKPWMGVVKNRCKNGDHYWVDAYVMPIEENGEIVEYQSVRFKPDENSVKRAAPLYKRLNEGKSIKPSFISTLSLQNRVILGNLFALLPILFTTQVEGLMPYSLLGLFTSALIGIIANTVITRPMKDLVNTAKKVFDNQIMSHIYTGRVDDVGSIQLALKMNHSQINAIIRRLSDTTKTLTGIADITSTTSHQTNQGVTNQQTDITSVSIAMTQMASAVQNVANNALMAAESTETGLQETSSGKQVVDSTIGSIHSLASEIQHAATVVEQLSEYSTNIDNILGVIKGIAEQTNLLALNAAIEAARAGEQGRGFAVVADEVRTLAGRTQESTLEIETMIERLQEGSQEAVKAMEKSRIITDESVQQAAKAGEALETITKAINTISDMNLQTATASEEQSAVANEINQNISNISEVADTTSQGAQISVQATEKMSKTIQTLDSLVTQFMKGSA